MLNVTTFQTKCKINVVAFSNFLSTPQESCLHSENYSVISNFDVALPRNEAVKASFLCFHFALWSQNS